MIGVISGYVRVVFELIPVIIGAIALIISSFMIFINNQVTPISIGVLIFGFLLILWSCRP